MREATTGTPMTSFEIERVRRPSRGEFERRFVATQTPVIISGAMEGWPALERWTHEYIKTRAGERSIRVSIAHQGVHFHDGKDKILDSSEMKLADYVDLITSETISDGLVYAAMAPIRKWLPELWDDLRYPLYVDSATCAPPNLWYGPGKSVSPLHYDENQNFLAQINGHKKVVLYPPREIRNLYPFPFHYAARHLSRVNVLEPDHARYPGYQRAACGVAHLGPGDMLFIPLFWWHAVTGLDQNISVNYWWKTPILEYIKHPRQTARGLCGLIATEARGVVRRGVQRRVGKPVGTESRG